MQQPSAGADGHGEGEEAVKNLKRMIRALEEINLINYLEERRGRE